jgi:hypothetical protein
VTTYGLRFRLKSSEPADEHFLAVTFDELEKSGWADDMSYPDQDGVYTLWMTVESSNPQGALGTAVRAITDAEHGAVLALATPSRPTTHFLSAEVVVDKDPIVDSELPLLAS